MGDKGEPQISACKGSDNWTCVTFRPDLAKFGMVALTDAMVALMRKRVYDMAGVLGKTVKARCAHARPRAACMLADKTCSEPAGRCCLRRSSHTLVSQ